MVTGSTIPEAIANADPSLIMELDVRDDLRNGGEPFSRIMDARRSLPAGGILCLRAIFEPVPLYRVMEKQGFVHWSEQLGADDWRVWFFPHAVADDDAATTPAPAGAVSRTAQEPLVLDVRGLEPPEPMVRTLEALAGLPPGATLIQVNSRVPQMLLPHLDARGCTYSIHEEADDRVRVVIHVPVG
jgi:TusA-related sulfurtransferase